MRGEEALNVGRLTRCRLESNKFLGSARRPPVYHIEPTGGVRLRPVHASGEQVEVAAEHALDLARAPASRRVADEWGRLFAVTADDCRGRVRVPVERSLG